MRRLRVSLASTVIALAFVSCNAILDNQPGVLAEKGESGAPRSPTPAPPEEPDAEAPVEDAGVTPVEDAGVTPVEDAGVTPVEDAGVTPTVDAGVTPVVDAGPALCPPGQQRCSGACVSATDPLFGCGRPSCAPCVAPNATSACAANACVIGACLPGFADCNANAADGCESDLSKPTTCGGCNVACPAVVNGTAACAAGACTLTCAPTFNACAGRCVANDDVTACGAACTACPVLPNSTPVCTAGACGLVCAAGFGNCDANPANGCEAVLATDPLSCGACGKPCLPGLACVAGVCTLVL